MVFRPCFAGVLLIFGWCVGYNLVVRVSCFADLAVFWFYFGSGLICGCLGCVSLAYNVAASRTQFFDIFLMFFAYMGCALACP